MAWSDKIGRLKKINDGASAIVQFKTIWTSAVKLQTLIDQLTDPDIVVGLAIYSVEEQNTMYQMWLDVETLKDKWEANYDWIKTL
jgi:NDP-sugar pyrophosphorylase family protein